MPDRENNKADQSFPEIEEIRSRLQRLGYLQSPVERYLSRPAGGPLATVLAVSGKVSLLAGTLLSGLALSATLLADPGFIENPPDVLLFAGYLVLTYTAACFVLVLLPAWFWMRTGRPGAGRRTGGRVRSMLLSGAVSAALCAYLLGWWHITGIGSRVVAPLGIVSLTVLAAILLICMMAGRLAGFLYFLLRGVPASFSGRKGPIARSYLVSAMVVLVLESAWMFGVFRYHVAASSLATTLEQHSARLIPILLVGLDGMDSETLFRMAAGDSLPNMAGLIGNGFTAEVDTREGYLAPQVWNTVATGVAPEWHGINAFTIHTLRGLTRQPYLGPVRPGLETVIDHVFPFLQLVRASPIAASSRRSRTVWEILELFGVPAGVLNWWASWPARPAGGFTVSERTFAKLSLLQRDEQVSPSVYYEHEVEPPAEFDSLAILKSRLDKRFGLMLNFLPVAGNYLEKSLATGAGELVRSVYLADLFYTLAAVELSGRYRVGMLAVYLQGADVLSRIDERTETVQPERIQGLIREYYCYLDRLLGELVQGFEPGGLILVVCEPGKIGRKQGEKGAVIFQGIDVKKGRRAADSFRLEDIAPTLLYLAGLPVDRSMHGHPRTETGEAGAGGASPLRYVSSYGPPPLDRASTPAYRHDREVIERLRSLGYIE
ncbi:MAG: alkaline phosphatase family protein [Candidatus Glassbacteria bacterium]|nr:alkaline phosphatase family protein [Candidatus Glassbacteria bacterium]